MNTVRAVETGQSVAATLSNWGKPCALIPTTMEITEW